MRPLPRDGPHPGVGIGLAEVADQLLDLARGRAANALDRSIDTQVSRLRRKLELDPAEPKIIKTVWGGGYMFTPAVSQQ